LALRLSQRIQRVKPSPTLAVTARAAKLRAEGKDIIGLGAGEPDFDTPQHIKDAAVAAMNAGHTRYTAVDGTVGLKKAIQAKFQRDNGLNYELNQIIASVGGKQTFYNLCQALLDSGDEVIIPAPYWVSYPDMVLLADGVPVIIEAGYEQGFKISPAQLEAAITPRTRFVVLNSPSNPTGVMYTEAELNALGDVLRAHADVLIVTDDIYEHILLSDLPFTNIATACPDLVDRCVVLNGVSKAYSMTGWRIGYAAGPAELIKAMNTVQSQSTSNPTSIAQYAAEAALNGDQSFIDGMNKAFRERHDFVYQALNDLRGVRSLPSQGAFYAFPDCREAIQNLGFADDVQLSDYLLSEAGVAVVPGSAFGASGYIRLSFATDLDTLKDALARMAGVLGHKSGD
jgi:aspartate aminotransferase